MAPPEAGTDDRREKSTAELLKDLSTQMTALVHQEVDLAKAELTEKGKKVGIGAGMFGAATVAALFALGALFTAVVAGLATALSLWLAALLVAAVLLIAAGILALRAKREIKQGTPPIPQQALGTTKEDVAWLKTQARSAKP